MRSSKLLARRLKSSGAAAEGAASSQEEKMARSFNVSSTLRLRDRRRLFRCQAAVSILPTQLSPRLALVFPSIVSTPDCLVLNSGKCSRQYQSVTVRRFHVHLEGSIRIR
ncbi:unnamed protein product [Mesocestoides corti]|uniref:Uncharacterized protein n=1 Tax=Mesocestoides corti TaxID=53468 RepID=A0A0R3UR52_MESCO|nr:unnamed protein product [Mesocestoides corti]